MADTASITKLREAKATAAALRSATSFYREKYGSDSSCDKKAFSYTRFCDRHTAAFKVPSLVFDAYAGYYGNSSVSNIWRVKQDIIDRLFAGALNAHKQAIFDHMADALEKEAAELAQSARKELEELQRLIDEADCPIVTGTPAPGGEA